MSILNDNTIIVNSPYQDSFPYFKIEVDNVVVVEIADAPDSLFSRSSSTLTIIITFKIIGETTTDTVTWETKSSNILIIINNNNNNNNLQICFMN